MQSMTGFGLASTGAGEKRFSIEIRSVNHRGLDVKIRSREPDATCDTEITRAVRSAVARGVVTVSVREEMVTLEGGRIDAARARATHADLEALRSNLGIQAAVDLATIAAFLHGLPARPADLRGEALWDVLRPAVTEALAALTAMRRREGEALAADLRGRLTNLGTLVAEIERGATALPARFARRLEERVAQLSSQVTIDPARLAQETLLMAERLDVSEELVRLRTHLGHMDELLAAGSTGDGGVGRKLDFIIQEAGRELNTIGSKAQDAEIAERVIAGKLELEKIREQAQNIE